MGVCVCVSVSVCLCGYTLTLRSLSKSTRVLTWTRTSRDPNDARVRLRMMHSFLSTGINRSIITSGRRVDGDRRTGDTPRRSSVRSRSRSRRRVPVPGKRLKSTDALNSRGERLGGATSKKRSSRLFVRKTRAFGVRRIGRDSGSGFPVRGRCETGRDARVNRRRWETNG